MLISSGVQQFDSSHSYTRQDGFPYWTVELTVSGTMLRRSGSMKRFRPQPNGVLVVSPPELHYGLRGESEGLEIWVILEPRDALLPFLEWARAAAEMPVLPLPEGSAGRRVTERLRSVHTTMAKGDSAHTFLATSILEQVLVEAVLQVREEEATDLDPRIARVIERLTAAPSARVGVAELAAEANLSESRFAHLFREQTGETPIAYVERLRLEQAQQLLLRSDLQIQEIAREVGFEEPTYFSTRFRKRFGKSPRHWRQTPS